MDRIYRIDIAGLSFAQDGVFNSLRGASSVIGGRLVGPVLGSLSSRRYTLLCNALGVAHLGIQAFSRSPLSYMSSMAPYVLGSERYVRPQPPHPCPRLTLGLWPSVEATSG